MGSSIAVAFSGGPPPNLNGSTASGGATCAQCHQNSAGGAGSVQILGVPTLYEPGATYTLTVRIADPIQVGAGYQFSVEDATGAFIGTLGTLDTGSQLNAGFINHTSTGVATSLANWVSLGNAAEYQFTWQAPATGAGDLTFWAIGNAIDDSFTNQGDLLYLTNKTAGAVAPVPTVSEWGLVVMLITLLTAGTIIMVRQRSRALLVRSRG